MILLNSFTFLNIFWLEWVYIVAEWRKNIRIELFIIQITDNSQKLIIYINQEHKIWNNSRYSSPDS